MGFFFSVCVWGGGGLLGLCWIFRVGFFFFFFVVLFFSVCFGKVLSGVLSLRFRVIADGVFIFDTDEAILISGREM